MFSVLEWVWDQIAGFFEALIMLPFIIILILVSGFFCTIFGGFACADLDAYLDQLVDILSSIFVTSIAILLFFVLIFNRKVVLRLIRAVVLFVPVTIPLFLYRTGVRFIAWLHYFFVPHPAERELRHTNRRVAPVRVDTRAVARAMEEDVRIDPDQLKPAYKSENQRRRAEALARRVEADRKLMEEIEARELARRRVEKAKKGV